MDRRAYLTALGAAAAAVSGCSQGNSTADTTGTGTDATPTATEQPTSTADQADPEPTPTVTDAGLLLDRGEYASLGGVDSVGRGAPLVVGAEYDLPVSDASAPGLVEARVLDSDGIELSTANEEIDAVVTDDSEFHSDSSWFAFDTTDWERGNYTVEVLVNAEGYGTTASTEVPAEVVEPLGEGEVEMYIAEFPDDAVAGETFDWTLGFRNLTDRDSSVVTDTVTIDPARSESFEIGSSYRKNVPAGGAITVEKTDNSVNYPGTYTYRIDRLDDEVSFTISPPE